MNSARGGTESTNRPGSAIVLVCDFRKELLSRILDVYRFFQEPPHIIVVRRGESPPTITDLSVQYETIPVPAVGFESRLTMRTIYSICTIVMYLLFLPALYLKIRLSRGDVGLVHAHFIFPQGLFGLVLARFLSVPFVVTVSGSDANLLMRNALIRAVSLWVLRRASVTIAVSKSMQARLQRLGITNTVYQPNSVDVASIPPVSESARNDSILFVGSMNENKQPLTLLRAFERVLNLFPTAQLTMCGDGPLESIVQRKIMQIRAQDRIRMLSYVPTKTLNVVRSQSAIFVLPSLSEGLSLALLEAMAAGQVVIVSRIESHEAVIEHGENGLLFSPGNPEEIANQIAMAIVSDALRRKLSDAAKRVCKKQFSNELAGPKLESLYLTTLA